MRVDLTRHKPYRSILSELNKQPSPTKSEEQVLLRGNPVPRGGALVPSYSIMSNIKGTANSNPPDHGLQATERSN